MKLQFVNYLPYAVFYWEAPVHAGLEGSARGPFVFIRPESKDDGPLHVHESVHVRQWYFFTGLSVLAGLLIGASPEVLSLSIVIPGLFYKASKAFRLRAEVQAYRAQIEAIKAQSKIPQMPWLASHLLASYLSTQCGVTKERALELLS
jgi:hypothetical protein